MSIQPHRDGPAHVGSHVGSHDGSSGGGFSGAALVLWGVALTLVVGALTLGALVVVRGGPHGASAADVVVDSPEVVAPEVNFPEVAAPEEITARPAEGAVVAPPGWTGVLAPEVGIYRVVNYSLLDLTGHLEPSDEQVVAGNDTFDVLLGETLVDAGLVFSVEVADQPATEDLQAAWTVIMLLADAQALADATADLGCHEKPDNMIAVVSGTDLLMLASLEADEYCGAGLTKGRIIWQTFYGAGKRTPEEARASAEVLAAGLLGTPK